MDGIAFAVLTGLVASVSPAGTAASVISVSIDPRLCLSYLAGTASARVIQGAVASVAALALLGRFGAGAFVFAPWQYVVLGLVGAGLIVSASHSLLRGRGGVRQVAAADLNEPGLAFATGFGIVGTSTRQWLFATAVVARLGDLGSEPFHIVLGFVLYALAASWFTLSLLAYRHVRPHGGDAVFERVHEFVAHHAHQLGPAIALAFGLLFVGLAADGYARLGVLTLLSELFM